MMKHLLTKRTTLHCYALLLCLAMPAISIHAQTAQGSLQLARIPNAKPRNIIFILTDDHRYDALGFLKGQSFIETPNLDALARNGVHLKNAFVTKIGRASCRERV